MDTAIFFLGFGLLAMAVNSACLILGRVLLGYPLVSQVFLCEILSTDRRGMGAAMYSILHSTGFSVVLFLGNHISLSLYFPLEKVKWTSGVEIFSLLTYSLLFILS